MFFFDTPSPPGLSRPANNFLRQPTKTKTLILEPRLPTVTVGH